jgi:hypothetical protein
LAELNLHDKPHLKSQVPAETFSMMRGVAEFGLSTIVNTNNRLCAFDRLRSSVSSIQTYIQRISSTVSFTLLKIHFFGKLVVNFSIIINKYWFDFNLFRPMHITIRCCVSKFWQPSVILRE